MTSDLVVRERLLRLAVLLASFFLIIWLIVVRIYPLEALWQVPDGTAGGAFYVLGLLVVPLAMLSVVFSMFVISQYNPNSLSERLVPKYPEKFARGAKWSWLPSDILMVVVPLLVMAQIPYQNLGPDSTLSSIDTRVAWIGSIAMIPVWIYAVVRWRSALSLTYISGVHIIRLLVYLYKDPRVFPDIWVVNGNSMAYALLTYLLVATIGTAASSLDSLMTQVTQTRTAITSRLAENMTRARAHRVIGKHVLVALNLAAEADDAASWKRAQEAAGEAVVVVKKALAPVPSVEADALTADEFLSMINADVSLVAPQVSVQVSSVRILPVPRQVANHLNYSLCELVSAAVKDGISDRFVTVQVTVSDREITCQLTIAPGYASGGELLAFLPTLEETLSALPGASVSTVSHVVAPPRARQTLRLGSADVDALAGVRIQWEKEAELLADATGDVHGHLRLTALMKGRLGLPTAIVMFAFFYIYFFTLLLMSTEHVQFVWLDITLLVAYLAIVSFNIARSLFISRSEPFPNNLIYSTAIVSFLTIAIALGNLGDMTGFSLEVEWWPVTTAIMVLTWLTGSSNTRVGFFTALAIAIVTAGWGLVHRESTDALTGAGIPMVIIVGLFTALISWSWQEIGNAAATRREDRVARLALAHHHAVNTERRALARYLDDVAFPFLVQLAASMPLTEATHLRAKQLAARVRDDQAAPIFHGIEIAQSAADARARGVTVVLKDDGALDSLDPYVLQRTVKVAVNALDAMVDGSVVVKVLEPGAEQAAVVRSLPATEEPRLIEVLPDGSVLYDGIRVRPTKQVSP